MHAIKTRTHFSHRTQADGLIKACMPKDKDEKGRRNVKVDVLEVEQSRKRHGAKNDVALWDTGRCVCV
jgi:hypothetical protein